MKCLSWSCVGLVVASLAACAPTLRSTPQGWRPQGAIYSIEALPQGRVMPEGWALANYTKDGDHFEKIEMNDPRDITARRNDDDGWLIVDTEELHGDALGKPLDILAARWLARVVTDPSGDASTRYDDLVPPLTTVTNGNVSGLRGFGVFRAETIRGRAADIVSHQEIPVAKGSGYALVADLKPEGAPSPDRKLFLAFLRPAAHAGRVVVVAYANAPAVFDASAPDAEALARRVRF